MTNKDKLKRILAGMSNHNSGISDAFKSVEQEMQRVADKIREEAQIQTIDDSKKRIKELRAEIQDALNSLIVAFDNLKSELGQNEKDLTQTLNTKLDALRSAMAQFRIADNDKVKLVSSEIATLRNDIKEIGQRKIKFPDYSAEIKNLQSKVEELSKEEVEKDNTDYEDCQKKIEDLKKEFIDLRKRTMASLGQGHGGNANRNILVAGNSSTLSRYTDLNIKPGANVTLTYTNNDNLKTTDLTIAASGGGGGTSRNISTVSVSSILAATAATDIVVIASAGVQLTMPTAVSNTNLYTIKNTSTSSVLINTTGGQTIDTSTTLIMPVQFTSVDLISDNSNWQIT